MLDLAAAPRLADAYADLQVVEVAYAPGDVAPAGPPATVDEALDPELAYELNLKLTKSHRLGKSGVVVYLGGYAVGLVGGVVLAVAAVDCVLDECNEDLLYGGLAVSAVGGVVSLTGMGMTFVGGINGARYARALGVDVSPTVGYVGVGLVAGGYVLTAANAGLLLTDTQVDGLGLLGNVCVLSGSILGWIQLGQVGRRGRESGLLALVPTAHGMAVAGSF